MGKLFKGFHFVRLIQSFLLSLLMVSKEFYNLSLPLEDT